MIIKFGTGIKLDVFYTMVTKICDITTITSLWRHNLYFSRRIGLKSDARNSQTPWLIWLKFGI